jgi:hypothetical protein
MLMQMVDTVVVAVVVRKWKAKCKYGPSSTTRIIMSPYPSTMSFDNTLAYK